MAALDAINQCLICPTSGQVDTTDFAAALALAVGHFLLTSMENPDDPEAVERMLELMAESSRTYVREGVKLVNSMERVH